MKKNMMEAIMNPVRQRIAQYLILHGEGTAGEMRGEMEDIPPASLYRHIKVLLDNGLIEVAEEKKIRGTLERTYRLAERPMGEMGRQDMDLLFQSGLMSLMSSFGSYFKREDADPQRDMLGFSTSTLMLTDEELTELLQQINGAFRNVIGNTPGKGRKPRRITFIISPNEE